MDIDLHTLNQVLGEMNQKETVREKKQNTVVMNNLPKYINQDDLYEFLKQKQSGKIKDIRFLYDGNDFRGKAFVEFYLEEDAQKILQLNKSDFKGQRIYVNLPNERREQKKEINKGILIRNLVGNLNTIKEHELRDLFSAFGDIQIVDYEQNFETGENLGFAILIFYQSEDASVSVRKMNGYLVDGVPIKVDLLPLHIFQFYNKLSNEDIQRLKDLPKRKEIINYLQDFQEVNQKDLQEKIFKDLLKKIRSHKYFSHEPSKVIGLFNLWDFLKGDLKEQKNFLKEMEEDVVEEVKRMGKIKEHFVDQDFKGLIFKMKSREDTRKIMEKFRQELFDGRVVICVYLKKRYLKYFK